MNRFKRQETPKPQQNIIHEREERELVIDDQNLNKELMDQPLLMKKYTKILAELNKKASLVKYKLEEREAELQLQFSSDGTGKRVADIEASITLDEQVKKLKRELLDAVEQAEQFTGIVKSIAQRHDALKDLCANARKELKD
jgi:hypothetical protein